MKLPSPRSLRNKHLRVVEDDPLSGIERGLGISLQEMLPALERSDRLIAAQGAIVMTLERGAHTSTELTRFSTHDASDIRRALRALRDQGMVTVSERDGRAVYALADDCA